jgi:hypothetical protein
VGWGRSAGTGLESSGGSRISVEEGDSRRNARGRSRLIISGVVLGLTASGDSGVRGAIGDSVPDSGVGRRLPDGVGGRLPDGVGGRPPYAHEPTRVP